MFLQTLQLKWQRFILIPVLFSFGSPSTNGHSIKQWVQQCGAAQRSSAQREGGGLPSGPLFSGVSRLCKTSSHIKDKPQQFKKKFYREILHI